MADAAGAETLIKSGFEPIADSGPEAGQQRVASETRTLDADHQGHQLQGRKE